MLKAFNQLVCAVVSLSILSPSVVSAQIKSSTADKQSASAKPSVLVKQDAPAQSPPKLLIVEGEKILAAKKSLAKQNSPLRPAYEKLIEEAEAALKVGPFTVTDKTELPPSKDKHDYMSFGTYWWPDPDAKDGLPYIRHDGKGNPINGTNASDKGRLADFSQSVGTLTWAYYFSNDKKYADRAALLIRTWFLDPKTKMNPHLQYAQVIRGRDQGRAIGIIDTSNLMRLVDPILMLSSSNVLSAEENIALKKWYAEYLTWLLTSENGKEEGTKLNNHGTYYDVQVSVFAFYTGQNELAKKVLQSVGKNRIAVQIEPDGRQPLELERTKSFGYSCGNAGGFLILARLGEHVGVDLWNYSTEDKRNIKAAVDYLAPYADPNKKWPHEQIIEFDYEKLYSVLLPATLHYQNEQYRMAIRSMPKDVSEKSRNRLMHCVEKD